MANPSKEVSLQINPSKDVTKIFWCLFIFELWLVLCDIIFSYGRLIDMGSIRRFCNIAREDSFATWFASTQILFVAVVLWIIYGVLLNSAGFVKRTKSWGVIALFFTYLAMDEGARIHERIGTVFDKIAQSLNADSVFGNMIQHFPSYTWHLIVGPFLVGMGLFIFWFLMKELAQNRLRILLFMALSCYAIAVGFDFVEGIDGAFQSVATWMDFDVDAVSHFSRVFEEFLEMLGTTFFLFCYLSYLTTVTQTISIRFSDK